MDSVLLKFQTAENVIEINVDDVDKVMWIDLIVEYEEEFRKKGYMLPKYPSFHYLFKQKLVKISSDSDLMSMLERLGSNKVITVYVGSDIEPSECVIAARNLTKTLNAKPKTSDVPQFEEAFVINEPNADDLQSHFYDTILENFERVQEQEEGEEMTSKGKKGKGRGKGGKPRVKLPVRRMPPINDQPPLAATTTFSNAPILEISNLNSTSSNHNAIIVHRIPRSTTARKGLLNNVNQIEEAQVSTEEEFSRRFENVPISRIEGDESSRRDHFEDDVPIRNDNNDNIDVLDREANRNDISEEEDDDDFGVIQDNYDAFADDTWHNELLDDDNYFNKMYKNGEFVDNMEFGNILLTPWMIFTDKAHFISVLRDYCIQCGFAIVVERSSPTRFTAQCLEMNCNWRLHSSVLPDGFTWAIKSIQNAEHTCRGLDERNPMVNVQWAASKVINDIRANNDIPGTTLNELLWSRYGVQMATSTLYKMRSIALKEINGGHDESYGHLPRYCEMVRQTNPGSAAYCAWSQQNGPKKALIFSSIFISFKGVIDGVGAGCRSLIGVDGAHLKGNYGGVLLSAVALDANNELYPLAWAIVSGEDVESWKFFFWHLRQILKDCNRGDDWCIISDRQKGIDPALTELWPEVGRRYCCKHLAKNWTRAFPGPLMASLFWLACSATSPFTFKKAMDIIQKANHLALVWLSKLGDQERWTKHKYDPKICSDENTSNFVESSNATLGVDRCRPILTLLEGIRRVCMTRIASRRKKCQDWNNADPCPKIVKRIRELMHDSRTCKAYQSREGEYEIREGKSMLPVSLNNKNCICGVWQITGIPCRHAIRAILAAGYDPHRYVSTWYSGRAYKQAYAHHINTIPDHEHWPEIDQPTIDPPTMKRSIGRPSRNRKKGSDEPAKGIRSTTVQCQKCKAYGHNSKTCKGGLTAKEKAIGCVIQQHKRQKTSATNSKSASQPKPTPSQPGSFQATGLQPRATSQSLQIGSRIFTVSQQKTSTGSSQAATRSKGKEKVL